MTTFQDHLNSMWSHQKPPAIVQTYRGDALGRATVLIGNGPRNRPHLVWDWAHGWWSYPIDYPRETTHEEPQAPAASPEDPVRS